MTFKNPAFMLQRAYEHLAAGAGALILTSLLLVTMNARAETPHVSPGVSPTVTILVPTVTIEQIDESPAQDGE